LFGDTFANPVPTLKTTAEAPFEPFKWYKWLKSKGDAVFSAKFAGTVCRQMEIYAGYFKTLLDFEHNK
jgi:hypothetical protein